MITRSKPSAATGPAGQILTVKYHEILTIKCNENGGFAGLSAIFTPSRENSYDKVQRDTRTPPRSVVLTDWLSRITTEGHMEWPRLRRACA
jgi:hypothetical protein